MTQHAGLTLERWSRFTLDEQILMIGCEMNRAGKLAGASDRERRASAYERAICLTDLTVEAHRRPTLRRELMLWRDLVAALCLERELRPLEHEQAFRALLLMTPEAARQIPYVLGGRGVKREP